MAGIGCRRVGSLDALPRIGIVVVWEPSMTHTDAPWSEGSRSAPGGADASDVAAEHDDCTDPTVPTTVRRRTTSRLLGVVAAAVAVVSLSGFLTACESTRPDLDAVRNDVNASRAAAGLPALRENVTLDIKADKWAQNLRDACRIWHSNLADGAPKEWRKLGENVGMGGSIDQIHTAYMNSPGHRANILDPTFTQIGTAAVWGQCNGYRTVFTVHVFMKT